LHCCRFAICAISAAAAGSADLLLAALFGQWIYDKEAAKKVQKDREREEKQDLQLLSISFAFVLGFDCVSWTCSI
jgi:hypothetical protein